MQNDKFGIIAGEGALPAIIINSLKQKNAEFCVINVENPNSENFIPIGKVSQILDFFKKENVKNIVLAGKVTKPNFRLLQVDTLGAKLITKIISNKIIGDDKILTVITDFLEAQNFKVVASHDIAADITFTKGTYTTKTPSDLDKNDIEIASNFLNHISKFDVGQAVIVADKQILALEAMQGTDRMLLNLSEIKQLEGGVLVKMRKQGQNVKIDLPTIGIDTVINCHKAKLSGIVIESSYCLVIDKKNVIDKANKLGLFIEVI